MEKISIFLVEDHLLVRAGIKALFDGVYNTEIIGEASDGYELLEKIKTTVPDIVIMDISLPKISGIEVAKLLKKDYPEIKILILSMHTSEDFIFNAIKAGVNGYLPKTTNREELIQAINEIHKGNEFFSKPIADLILKSYMKKARFGDQESDTPEPCLTVREKEILKLIAEGFLNGEIAEKLFISIRTVETHKTHIMQKLGLSSTVDLVKFAIRNKIIQI